MAQQKIKIRLKHKKGALHIGGGRLFLAGEEYTVSTEERDALLKTYKNDLEEVKEQANADGGK